MITFDPYKTKSLTVPIRVKGIQSESLNFYFVIKENNVNFSFPAKSVNGDEVSFEIPPLSNVIQEVESGEYDAHIEVNAITESYKGFYMKPWTSKVKIKVSPEVNVEEIEEDTDSSLSEEEEVTVGELKEKDIKEETSEPKKEKEGDKKKSKKNTRMSKVLKG